MYSLEFALFQYIALDDDYSASNATYPTLRLQAEPNDHPGPCFIQLARPIYVPTVEQDEIPKWKKLQKALYKCYSALPQEIAYVVLGGRCRRNLYVWTTRGVSESE